MEMYEPMIPPHPREELQNASANFGRHQFDEGYILPNTLSKGDLSSRVPKSSHQSQTTVRDFLSS